MEKLVLDCFATESEGIYVYPREKREETDEREECDGEERAARWELKKKRWD